MERSQDIVTRRMIMSVIRLQRERPAHTVIWVLGARRWQKKEGEAEEDMVNHLQRRPGRDGC